MIVDAQGPRQLRIDCYWSRRIRPLLQAQTRLASAFILYISLSLTYALILSLFYINDMLTSASPTHNGIQCIVNENMEAYIAVLQRDVKTPCGVVTWLRGWFIFPPLLTTPAYHHLTLYPVYVHYISDSIYMYLSLTL